jgi:hypothetical protein
MMRTRQPGHRARRDDEQAFGISDTAATPVDAASISPRIAVEAHRRLTPGDRVTFTRRAGRPAKPQTPAIHCHPSRYI